MIKMKAKINEIETKNQKKKPHKESKEQKLVL
jgi:hypothetical protein